MKKNHFIQGILFAITLLLCNNIYSQQHHLVFSAVQNLANIAGTIHYSGGAIPPNSATVELFQKINLTKFNRVDTVPLTGMTFLFDSIAEGDYFVKVRIDDNSFDPNVLSTYYDSVSIWRNADTINVNCDSTYNINIHLYEITIPAGTPTGKISGTIYYINTGSKNIETAKSPFSSGNPVTGGEIYIQLEPDDEPIANTQTDTAGYFSFTGLPEGNSYSLSVDIPGLPMISTYTVSVNSSDTVFTSMNFYVDTSATNGYISIDSITKTPIYVNSEFTVSVYPNPIQDNFKIAYQLNKASSVTIELFDELGKNAALIANSEQQSGTYNYNLNVKKTNMKKGIWFLKFTVGKSVYLKKIIIE